jgi:ribosomal protein S11
MEFPAGMAARKTGSRGQAGVKLQRATISANTAETAGAVSAAPASDQGLRRLHIRLRPGHR